MNKTMRQFRDRLVRGGMAEDEADQVLAIYARAGKAPEGLIPNCSGEIRLPEDCWKALGSPQTVHWRVSVPRKGGTPTVTISVAPEGS